MILPDTSAELLADPFFPRLKALVIETTGMAFYLDKDEDLARIVQARMEECGRAGCASYLDLLQDPVSGKEEMDSLVAELTIGETYFFRHKEQFDALRETILPEVIARNQSARRLRIWSAGCATGPEPYSIAILLKREFGVRIRGWDVSIIGTDINQKFLARAREGRYDEWAFRTMPDDIRRDCFDPVGRQWEIRPEYKSWVNFQFHNLTRNRFPSVLDNIANFDVIVCRNVIIYFSKETVEQLIPCFRAALVDNGWLVMGHAEPNQDLFRSFRTVNVPGAVLYQKVDRPVPGHCAVTPSPLKALLAQPLPTPRPVRPLAPRIVPSVTPPAAPPPSAPSPAGLAAVRAMADGGAWVQAAGACDDLLKHTPMDARIHFFRALIHEQMGEGEAAEASLRRAIYLDRHFVMPHYHLGLFLLRRDDAKGAARSFRNVLALLERLSDDHPLADGDEITAGGLRQVVGMHLTRIGGA